MTRLSVWYVRRLLETGEIAPHQVAETLSTRVDLYRFTQYWDGRRAPAEARNDACWTLVTQELAAMIVAAPTGGVQDLEEACLKRLQPLLEARLKLDIGPPPQRPFVCWTYEPGWEGLWDPRHPLRKWANPRRGWRAVRKLLGLPPPPVRNIVLHIMNAVVPRSPFDDIVELRESLRRLIVEARTRFPAASELWCDTWLNRHPKFQLVFPPQWFANGVQSPMGNSRNWWGQFATRTGDFNERLAQQFRAGGGRFPYPPLLCHASLQLVERHLASGEASS